MPVLRRSLVITTALPQASMIVASAISAGSAGNLWIAGRSGTGLLSTREQPASKPLRLKLKRVARSQTKPRVAQPGFVQRVVVRGMSISLAGLRFTGGG